MTDAPATTHPSRTVDERVDELLAGMTLEEKAALMFHTAVLIGEDGELLEAAWFSTRRLVLEQGITHFNIYQAPPPDPFVDEEAAERIVGAPAFRAAGEQAQRRAIVLLENRQLLPLVGTTRLYVEGVDPQVAAEYAEVVERLEDADAALVRLRAPYEPRPGFLQQFFHCGSLAFPEEDFKRILALIATVPTVVDVFLDRAAVLPELAAASGALLASFGAADAAVLDVAFGRFTPTGVLPFELPSSMDAVEAQRSDVPFDSRDPLYPFGHGLTY